MSLLGDLEAHEGVGEQRSHRLRERAYREGLRSDPKVLIDAVRRNVTMAQPDEAEALVQRMAALHARLARTSLDQLKAGEIAA